MTQHTPLPLYAKDGYVHIPLEAVVGSRMQVILDVTAICPSQDALLAAAKELRKVRYSGGFCPWCGQSQADQHLTLCPTFMADAAIAAVEVKHE